MTSSNCLNTPNIPRDHEGPIFSSPWEARAFAMVVTLSNRGLFEWTEWASTFSAEIAQSEHALEGHTDDYYECWVNAAEKLLERKGVLSQSDFDLSAEMTLKSWPHPDHTPRREPITIDRGI
jgi:nitrile hydratase accessory protein